MPYTEMDNITPAKLALISERARKEPKCQFISLAHLLNEGFLKECYYRLGRDRASGIDGVSWKEYGEHLDENLNKLVARMKAKRYKPRPVKRVYIPKNEHEKRPLGLLLKIRHIDPYQAYCEHCDILYRRVLEPLGYEYQFNPPQPDQASCSIVVKKK